MCVVWSDPGLNIFIKQPFTSIFHVSNVEFNCRSVFFPVGSNVTPFTLFRGVGLNVEVGHR